jgi:hypothetical protein
MHPPASLHIALIVLSGAVGAWVGFRLLLLAKRTRKGPEFQVGTALISWSLLGQPLALCLGPLSGSMGSMGSEVLELCYTGYWLSWVIVYTGLAFFCRSVFDTGRSPLRAILFGLSWMPGAIAWCVIVVLGTSAGPIPEAICNLTCAVGFGWSGTEALLYWKKLRRRQTLGLADPVVTNRFLLWGCCSVATSPIAFWVFTLAIQGYGLGSGYAPAEVATSIGGLLNTAVWFLTFVPPKWYVHFVRSRTDLSETAHSS